MNLSYWLPKLACRDGKLIKASTRITGCACLCLLPILSALLYAVPARAQDIKFQEFNTWADLATIKNYSDRFRYDGDYGIRGLLTSSDWTLVYLRPSVRYRMKPWLTLHGGAALFYNFFDGEDLPELRPWVGRGGVRWWYILGLVCRGGRL